MQDSQATNNPKACLWDTLCTGDNKSLWLSEEEAKLIPLTEQDLVIEDFCEDGAGK